MNKNPEEKQAQKVAFRDMQNEAREKHIKHVNYVKREDDILSYSKFRLMVDLQVFDI